jgi:glucokinase
VNSHPSLLVDLGATNIRLALVKPDDPSVYGLTALLCADYPSLTDAIASYLNGLAIDQVVMAVAAPLDGDQVCLTNSSWSFSIDELGRTLRASQCRVVNDFAAIARAVPLLNDHDFLTIGPEHGGTISGPLGPVAILGPGTGLGVSLLAGTPPNTMILETEGGHVTLAATDDKEARIIGFLRQEFGHVSAERVLSGPGLTNLYRALGHLSGQSVIALTADKIVASALGQGDPLCLSALDMFFAMLGTVAGNLALTVGAKGGVVLAGGILPRLQQPLLASRFRAQFEAKGRFCPWLQSVETRLIIHPQPAIVGLTGLL